MKKRFYASTTAAKAVLAASMGFSLLASYGSLPAFAEETDPDQTDGEQTPSKPEDTDTPDTGDTDKPETPETPDNPDTPDTPETPGESSSTKYQTDDAGEVKMGDGDATIKLTGNEGQTLVGKKFEVFELLFEKNSENGESVAYSWNPAVQKPLQKVIGEKLKVDPDTVTIEQAVDYIQSLREDGKDAPSGATGDQPLQSSNSEFRQFVEAVRDAIKADGIEGDTFSVTKTASDNSVTITGLSYGYYLVDELADALPIGQAASLCMVTTANPNATIHIKSDIPGIEKKVQENSDKEWGDVADFEIGELVPFKYTSNVPNMNGYKSYYWAAQDKSSECLTFQPDTVEITIASDTKTYTLTPDEFKVDDTATDTYDFQIEIPDLKAIVDREFDNKDKYGENTYGQTITVTYESVLNEKASDFIGQPLENEVRLVFSSNPDSEGDGETNTTPWDKVVVFTFELDNLKVNTDQAPLKGAEFQLYRDEACTDQILVKAKEGGGYIVMNADTANKEEAVDMVSDGDGTFKIYGLDDGVYYLKETKAPEGYYPLKDPIKITIESTYTEADPPALESLKATSSIGNSAETDLETSVDTGIINNKIVNTPGDKLPITGSSLTIVLLAAGAALVGYGVVSNKKLNRKQRK